MGAARKYPEIRAMMRFQYAMLFLPSNIRDDEGGLRQQWIDNNFTYLDSLLLELYLEEDHNFMRFTWPEYHYLHKKYAAHAPHALPPTLIPIYSHPSSTPPSYTGYPGEGPAKIATFNINGAKDKLYHVLAS